MTYFFPATLISSYSMFTFEINTFSTTTEQESTSITSGERPSISTPGFSFLLVGFAILSVLVLLRRKH
ncbi:MAG: hypothetical protein ACW991_09205 [Candidatus Hodarchaeales archaeon]